MAAQLAGAVVTGLGVAGLRFLKTSIDVAAEYDRQSRRTLTQVDNIRVSLQEVADVGRRVARDIGVPFEELQDTLFFIFSSMDVNIKEAEFLLRGFSKEAIAGQADLESAARTSIAIMNALQVPVKDLTRLQDVQFQIVRKGIISYEELSKTIGRALPATARAGQSFETLGAMIAFMTRNGLSAAFASTSAARALESFAHPTVVGRLEAMGIAVRDQAGEYRPLLAVMRDMNKTLGDMAQPERTKFLQELFAGAGGTIQSRRFWDLAFKNFGKFDDMVGHMKNSAGVFNQAYATMSNSVAVQSELVRSKWMLIKEALGRALMPAFLQLLGVFSKVLGWFDKLPQPVKSIITQFILWGSIISVVIGVLLVIIGTLGFLIGGILIAGEALVIFIAGLAALVASLLTLGAVFILSWKNSENFRKTLSNIASIFEQLWSVIVTTSKGIGQAFSKHLLPPLQKLFQVIENDVAPAIHRFQALLAKEVIPKVKEAGRIIKSIFSKAFELLGFVIERVAIPAIQKITEWWREHTNELQPLIKAFAQVVKWVLIIAAIFVGILIVALAAPIIVIGLVVGAVALLIFAFSKLIQFVKFLAGKIAEFFVGLWNRLVGIWNSIIGVVVFAMTLIGKQIAFGIAIVKAIWNSFWNVFGGLFKAIWQLILAIVKLYTTMFTEVWKDWLVPLGRFFVNIWNSITKFFVGVWNGIVRFVSGKWNTLTKLADIAWRLIKSKITGPINAAKDTISSVMSKIRGLWDRGWEAVRKVVVDKLNKARDTVKNKIQAVRDLFKNAKNWLFQAGRNIIQGLIDGVTSKIESLTSKLNEISRLIPQIKGPRERDLRLLQPAGQHIIQGLMRGINDVVPELTSQLTNISSLVSGQIRPPRLINPLGVVSREASRDNSESKVVNQYVTINTNDLDPERQAIELGWLLAARM
jgi:TP901 family phage tail tape measure protein